MKLCDALLQRLSSAVKQLQHLQIDRLDDASLHEFEVTDKCEDLQRLAMCLDAMFMNGLRSAAKGYFKFVRYFTHKDVLYDLDHRMFRVSTEIGLGRAWLYRALSENLLECYLQNMTDDQGRQHVLKFYYKEALLADQASLQVALMTIAGLENIRINLTWDLPFLDVSACDIALKIRSESEVTADRESSRGGSIDGGKSGHMGSRTSSLVGEEVPSSITLPMSCVENSIVTNVEDFQDSAVVTENFQPENDELQDEIVVSRKFLKRKKPQKTVSINDPALIARDTFNSYYSLAGDSLTFDNTSIMSVCSERSECNTLLEIEESALPTTTTAIEVASEALDCNLTKIVESTNVIPTMLPSDYSVEAKQSTVSNINDTLDFDLTHFSFEKEAEETYRPISYSIYSNSNKCDNDNESIKSLLSASSELISYVPDLTALKNNIEEFKDVSANCKSSFYFEDSCKFALEEDSMPLELDIDNNTKLELLLNVFSSDVETLLGMFRVLVSSSFISQVVMASSATKLTSIPRSPLLLRSFSSCMNENHVDEYASQQDVHSDEGGHQPQTSRLRLSSLLLAITTKYLHLVRRCAVTERYSRLMSLPVASIDHVCVSLRSIGIYVHLRASQPRCQLWLGEPRLVENLVTHLSQLHNGSICILRDATYQRLTLRKWIANEQTLRSSASCNRASEQEEPWLHYCMLGWEVCSATSNQHELDLAQDERSQSDKSSYWSGAGVAELSGLLSWRSNTQHEAASSARRDSFVGMLASSFSRSTHESAVGFFRLAFFRLRGRVLARYALDLASDEPSEVEQRWLLSSETCSSCRMLRLDEDKSGRNVVLQIRMKDCAGGHFLQLTGKNIDKWLIACCAAVALTTEQADQTTHLNMLAQPLFSAVITPSLLLLGVESVEECRVFTAAVTLISDIAQLGVDTTQPNYLRLNFFESHVDHPWLLYFASVAERNAFARTLSDVWLRLCQVPIQVSPLDVDDRTFGRSSRDSPSGRPPPLHAYRASAKAVHRVFRQSL